MKVWEILVMIAIMAVLTLLTRALPFLIFPANKPTPSFIAYLGKALPFAIIGMLIVYCLKAADPFGPTHALPELISVAVVAGLYLWRRNSLLSIGVGTVLYMVLVQAVFV